VQHPHYETLSDFYSNYPDVHYVTISDFLRQLSRPAFLRRRVRIWPSRLPRRRALLRRPFLSVTNGRFKGGYTTRHYGHPAARRARGADGARRRGYLDEPQGEVDLANWPCPWDDAVAAPMRAVQQVLSACLAFAAAARA